MLGTALLWIAFAAAIFTAVAYYQTGTRKWKLAHRARQSYLISAASIFVASALLLLYILRHQFEYGYIWEYSSRDLPTSLLITTFWAGQEGSFLFWTLCTAIIGVVLLPFTRQNRIEYEVMSVYVVVQAFLLLLLISKSPFQYIWDAFPKEVAAGQIPADGRGLNPLLQNFWMIVHPPVLFIGFAAMAVPFALAVAALWQRTYSDWIGHALPWTLFGVLSLGAGLMLGGYWAYGVLGWGGWWGWDPVENSSLIPWITGVALLHTMVAQKYTGRLARTNFFLSIITFLLVIYSTFLTRSGVLGEASVHSFTDPGAWVYVLLVGWIALMGVIGFGMLSKRWKEISRPEHKLGLLTKESFLAIGTAILGASAVVIFFGTSWPIVGNSTVEPSFYDKTNLPIAILMSLVLGVSLKLRWHQESGSELFKLILYPLIAAIIGIAVLTYSGVQEWQMAALAFAALFVFFTSVEKIYNQGIFNFKLLGGPIAHLGLALLLLGIIGSGRYGEKQTTTLPLNTTKEIFGYRLTYAGAQLTNDGKWKFVVNVEQEGQPFKLEPVMFESKYNNSIMKNPDYASFLTRDFYIEPVSLEQAAGHPHAHSTFDLTKGVPVEIEGMRVTFLRFDMGGHGAQGMMSGGGFTVGAVLEVNRNGKAELVTPVTVYEDGQQSQPQTAMLKDGIIGFQLLAMNIDMDSKTSQIQINVVGLKEGSSSTQPPEALVVEASLKPFMSLVWIAALLVLVGVTLAMNRRREESRIVALANNTTEKKQKSNERSTRRNGKRQLRTVDARLQEADEDSEAE